LTRFNAERVRSGVAVEAGSAANTFNKKFIFGKWSGLQQFNDSTAAFKRSICLNAINFLFHYFIYEGNESAFKKI
jgi:hypothetical protein